MISFAVLLVSSLRSCLKNVPVYRIEIPHTYKSYAFEQMHKFITQKATDKA